MAERMTDEDLAALYALTKQQAEDAQASIEAMRSLVVELQQAIPKAVRDETGAQLAPAVQAVRQELATIADNYQRTLEQSANKMLRAAAEQENQRRRTSWARGAWMVVACVALGIAAGFGTFYYLNIKQQEPPATTPSKPPIKELAPPKKTRPSQ